MRIVMALIRLNGHTGISGPSLTSHALFVSRFLHVLVQAYVTVNPIAQWVKHQNGGANTWFQAILNHI